MKLRQFNKRLPEDQTVTTVKCGNLGEKKELTEESGGRWNDKRVAEARVCDLSKRRAPKKIHQSRMMELKMTNSCKKVADNVGPKVRQRQPEEDG